jgi:hypothetical protein
VPVVEVMVRPLIVLLVKASDPASVAKVPEVGSVTLVAPVLVKVIEFAPDVAKVEPFARVRVPVVDEIVKPLIEVAVATPNDGVTNVGELANTKAPFPVSSPKAEASPAEVVIAESVPDEPDIKPVKLPSIGTVEKLQAPLIV